MLNFGASKPRVGGGLGPRGPPLDPHLFSHYKIYLYFTENNFPTTLFNLLCLT